MEGRYCAYRPEPHRPPAHAGRSTVQWFEPQHGGVARVDEEVEEAVRVRCSKLRAASRCPAAHDHRSSDPRPSTQGRPGSRPSTVAVRAGIYLTCGIVGSARGRRPEARRLDLRGCHHRQPRVPRARALAFALITGVMSACGGSEAPACSPYRPRVRSRRRWEPGRPGRNPHSAHRWHDRRRHGRDGHHHLLTPRGRDLGLERAPANPNARIPQVRYLRNSCSVQGGRCATLSTSAMSLGSGLSARVDRPDPPQGNQLAGHLGAQDTLVIRAYGIIGPSLCFTLDRVESTMIEPILDRNGRIERRLLRPVALAAPPAP